VNVTVIDYGVGNLRSLRRGLERAGADVAVTDDREAIADAAALVLPGVGAFAECMRNSRPYHDLLREKAAGTPLLGICVGHQLLKTESEEVGAASETAGGRSDGATPAETVAGLDLIDGRVRRLPGDVKVPHMGWNTLEGRREHPLVEGIDGGYAYFVHSYCSAADDRTLASCDYGIEFAAVEANRRGNVMGTQFHPEKSGEIGLRVLENFVAVAEAWPDVELAPAAADAADAGN